MASATGIPAHPPPAPAPAVEPDVDAEAETETETEPLLGKPGDAVLPVGASIMKCFWLGTGVIAQLGVVILFADIWAHVFSHKLIFFSGHPLAMSLAVYTLIQSVLLQQPITQDTPRHKRLGRRAHATLNLFALVAIVTGVTIVEVNKFRSKGPHFHSAHAYIGALTLVFLAGQYFVGLTMWLTPRLYGGQDKAKSYYKAHRWAGYAMLLALLATVLSATGTDYVESVLGVGFWTVFAAALLVLAGVLPRIQLHKLGFQSHHPYPAREVERAAA